MQLTMPILNDHRTVHTYLCDRCGLWKWGWYDSATDTCTGFYRFHREAELAPYRQQVVDARGTMRQEDFVCAHCLHADPAFRLAYAAALLALQATVENGSHA